MSSPRIPTNLNNINLEKGFETQNRNAIAPEEITSQKQNNKKDSFLKKLGMLFICTSTSNITTKKDKKNPIFPVSTYNIENNKKLNNYNDLLLITNELNKYTDKYQDCIFNFNKENEYFEIEDISKQINIFEKKLENLHKYTIEEKNKNYEEIEKTS